MKKKRLLLLATLPMLALAGCTIGQKEKEETTPEEPATNPDTENLDGDDYDAWANSWSKPGHVYFHYNRGSSANDYTNYCLWVWPFYPDSLEGTLWGYGGKTQVSDTLTLKPMSTAFMTNKDLGFSGDTPYKDKFGVIYDVDLTNTDLVGGKTGTSVSFEGTTEIGFLFPRVDSMDGSKNWISDGGTENYIEDYAKPENWRSVGDGKALHIFTQTGSLEDYRYFAGSGSDYVEPVKNPIDEDTTGQYRSKFDTITACTDPTPTDDKFKSMGVGYQIFVASFRDSNGDGIGDIRGIIDSLDYLEDLGVQCLWLTPIQKSGSYHGYDTIDYKEVDKRFGTMEDYEELLTKAHSRGMTVLMDLVLNHTSKSNQWFTKSKWAKEEDGFKWRDVYTWKYETDKIQKAKLEKQGNKWVVTGYDRITVKEDAESDSPSWFRDGESHYYYYGKFGSGMPEINYESKATRDLIIDTAKFWIDKGLDGFRLDAVKHIYMFDEYCKENGDIDGQNTDFIITDVGEKTSYDEEKGKYVPKKYDYSSNLTKNVNWWKEFSSKLKAYASSKSKPCFLVGENFDGWGTRTAPYYQALDSQFDFSNYYHVPAWIYNTDAGASSFDTKVDQAGQAFETYDAFAYGGDDYPYGDGGDKIPGGKRSDFINGAFTSNHDVMRLINQANGIGNKDNTTAADNVKYGDEYAEGKAKFQAAVTILNPGLSWIYYGDELGMTSNTYEHIEKYGSENNMDIWYRQPFLWKEKKVRANYKSGQYAFELDEHNRHLVNNDEGISYKAVLNDEGNVTGHKIATLSTMYPYFKTLTNIKRHYPKGAMIRFEYSSENVLRIVVSQGAEDKMVIFLNNGRNTNEYLMNVDAGFSYLDSTEGAANAAGGDIGKSSYGVCAFIKG